MAQAESTIRMPFKLRRDRHECQRSLASAIGLTLIGRMSDTAVACRGLVKRYGSLVAVDGLDLEVRTGECFGLLGPNGSGKSTTVKLILGLLKPTRGSLKVLGKEPRDVQTKRRIGYLPEDSYLYRYLTAEEVRTDLAR